MSNERSIAARVLIADDDEFVREHVRVLLTQAGLDVTSAQDGAAASACLRDRFDLAVLDLDMPGATGLEVLTVAQSRAPKMPVIILSGAGEVADAVLALKRGAFDYITKPFDQEELLARVREGLRVSRLEEENAALRSEHSGSGRPIRLIAEADASKQLLERAERCAGVDSNVLITGPSGTGKSAIARWIHQRGSRANGPFVTVNCGALPRELIESELFGHEKGAFTGAMGSRQGRFESADGGTLFLDEIGELPLDLQPKLLTAIQERSVTRLGSTRETPVDVRIIAATNRDLQQAISDREFREDLFFRLHVLALEVPGLSARVADIRPLAAHTLDRLAERLGRGAPALDEGAAVALERHAWPGNIRELENVLERALVFASGPTVTESDIGSLSNAATGPTDNDLIGVPLADLERRAILATLAHHGGNRAAAAATLGVSERTIYNRLKEYGRDAD